MMERSIENSHLRNSIAEEFARGKNALDVFRIVQGSKINTVFNPLQHLVVDQCRFGELFTPVHHAVSHGLHVRRALDLRYARLFRGYVADHVFQRRRTIAEGSSEFLARPLPALKLDGSFTADPLHFSPAEAIVLVLLDALKISGNHLKFQAGASEVHNQDIHAGDSLTDRAHTKINSAWQGRQRCQANPHVNLISFNEPKPSATGLSRKTVK